MPLEMVKDNQWWYSQSTHRARVENALFAVLLIGGRECPMRHCELGTDGRTTPSFKFLRDEDRDYWASLRAQAVNIEVVESGNDFPDTDDADEPAPPNVGGPPVITEMPLEFPRRGGKTHFDSYVFVDWSARSRPRVGRDSIWMARGEYGDNGSLIVPQPENLADRQIAETRIRDLLIGYVKNNRRVLVGFDFPYGYPTGWQLAIAPGTPCNWIGLWDIVGAGIVDGPQNQNNRWAFADTRNAITATFNGPYWGRPVQLAGGPHLPNVRPACFADNIVQEYRQIESQLRVEGRYPKSVWQLFGNGTVGSQSLLGIPVLHRLRDHPDLQQHSRVWPFETRWEMPIDKHPAIVHAEIWPGAIHVNYNLHPVRDAAQVLSYVFWAAGLDVTGLLAPRFNPFGGNPPDPAVMHTEGWILR